MSKDLYSVLEIDKSASEDDIKKAFKKLALKHHPDKRGGDPEKFKEINEAYSVLSDPNKKKMYDQFGTVEMAEMGNPMNMGDMENIFENLFGFGFPGAGGNPKRMKKAPQKVYELPLTLEEVYNGKKIDFRIKKKIYKGTDSVKCKECKGKGQVVHQINMGFLVTQNITTCPKCSGNGISYNEKDFITVESELEIPIPRGIPEGNQIVMKGKGDELPNMDPGDVIFVPQYKPHSVWKMSEKEPLDIITEITISLYEALYGFRKTIKHLDNRIFEIFQSHDRPIARTIHKPIEKVIPNEGMIFHGHKGAMVLTFTIKLPDPTFISLKNCLEDIAEYDPDEDKPSTHNVFSRFIDIHTL